MVAYSKYRPLSSLNIRKNNRFIVLTHMSNCSVRLNPMKPDLKGFLPYFTTPQIRHYYREHLERPNVPFHYHSNMIMKDWELMVVSPLNSCSDIMQSASIHGYIDPYYKDAIVIAIQDDYSLRTPDIRTFETIGSQIISPLIKQLKLPRFFESVVWFDEIFNFKKYNNDFARDQHNMLYEYEVNPMRYFDKVTFNLEVGRFI